MSDLGPEFPSIYIHFGKEIAVSGRCNNVDELQEFIRRLHIVKELIPFQKLGTQAKEAIQPDEWFCGS